MNLQFKASAQVLEQEQNTYCHNDQASFAKNFSDLYSEKTAPNKVTVTNSHCTWLFEDNSKFHFA